MERVRTLALFHFNTTACLNIDLVHSFMANINPSSATSGKVAIQVMKYRLPQHSVDFHNLLANSWEHPCWIMHAVSNHNQACDVLTSWVFHLTGCNSKTCSANEFTVFLLLCTKVVNAIVFPVTASGKLRYG